MYINFINRDVKKLPFEFGINEFSISDEVKIKTNYYHIKEDVSYDSLIKNNRFNFGKIANINFFVGINNSGKSRFLRGLFKLEHFSIIESNDKIPSDIFDDIESLLTKNPSLPKNLNTISEFWYLIKNKISENYKYEELLTLVEDFEKSQLTTKILYPEQYQKNYEFLRVIIDYIKFRNISLSNKPENKCFIPILRSLINDDNLNKESFNKITEIKYDLKDNVFTGLRLFDEVFKLHNSINIIKLENFAKWLEENFYTGKDIKIIPDTESKNLKIKIDDEIHNIFDIGDGIQQLILLLFPIFTAEDKTWFFIEEPETHLHPGLQRIFIETLLDNEYLKSKNLRYFFTTHSNHFLDLSLHTDDISIFQFQKETKEKFNIKSVKPNKETLDLLGVNNSSVLMANSSVWVEGPTDRKYISRFLKLYCEYNQIQHLKEDIDFAFFEYGGNLIEHYLFDEDFEEIFTEKQVRDKINSFALANRIYLLADNDNAEGKKLERREKLVELSEKDLNFKYQNTNYREIENLLPLRVVKDFMVDLVKTSDKDKIEKIDFKREDYILIGLGDFVVNLFETNNIKDFKKFKDESGTLKSSYKLKLCNMVVEKDYSYDDLVFENNELNELVENLYKFIKNQA